MGDVNMSGLLCEPYPIVKEISMEEFTSKMQNYEMIGFRVVLREGK